MMPPRCSWLSERCVADEVDHHWQSGNGKGWCNAAWFGSLDDGEPWDRLAWTLGCETSGFFVSGRSAVGWRGDWAAWFYPERRLLAAVRFCRYAPNEAPPEWLALELTSQVQKG